MHTTNIHMHIQIHNNHAQAHINTPPHSHQNHTLTYPHPIDNHSKTHINSHTHPYAHPPHTRINIHACALTKIKETSCSNVNVQVDIPTCCPYACASHSRGASRATRAVADAARSFPSGTSGGAFDVDSAAALWDFWHSTELIEK